MSVVPSEAPYRNPADLRVFRKVNAYGSAEHAPNWTVESISFSREGGGGHGGSHHTSTALPLLYDPAFPSTPNTLSVLENCLTNTIPFRAGVQASLAPLDAGVTT